MPTQTNYGYTGTAATSGSTATVAAGAAAVGTAALAAGAYYAYTEKYGDSPSHRRRTVSDIQKVDWCIVMAPGSRSGDFMQCNKCYDLFGYSDCQSAKACNTATGCTYTATQNFIRDDLALTGFVPKRYTFPFQVTFTSITGGIDTDPVTGICPPVTKAQADLIETFNKTMSFKPQFFVVLTKQDVLRQAMTCDTDTTATCTSTCYLNNTNCESGVCVCENGYCWNGDSCALASTISRSWSEKLSWPLLALVSYFGFL